MKYDVFISYSRKDFDEVSALIETIRAEIPGLSMWFDITGIESGDEFEDKIISAIDNSSYLLFALSDNSLESQWTKDEVMYAKNTDKKVIPVMLKGASLKGWFLFKFGRVDCIDFSNPLQKEKLLKNLSDWTGKARDSSKKSKKSPIKVTPQPVPQQTPQPEPLCPCESGKLFKDCHGKSAETPETAASFVRKPAEPKQVVRTWNVGDYFDVDGKKGVVFWVDETGKHGKLVSLDEAYLSWCTEEEWKKKLLVAATDKYDGMKNLQAIMNISDWKNQYPAFAWCANHGTGWYLPALEEINELCLNDEVLHKVNATLSISGQKKITLKDQVYWSSSRKGRSHAYYVMDSSIIVTFNFDRYFTSYVRAVSAF